jgi:hypothetical protein
MGQMKKKFLLLILITFLIAGFWLVNKNRQRTKLPIHYHVGFLVYIDGVLQDFSDQKYMEISACRLVKEPQTPQELQIEKAHLHDNVGDVVHVHQPGSTWQDLFTNINFTFPEGKPIAGYINGKQIENILSYPIKPYDSVIIIVGDSSGIDLSKYVTVEYIKEVEKKSESCGN